MPESDDDDDIRKIRFSGGPLDSPTEMKAAAELWRAIGLAACSWARLEQYLEAVLIHLNQPKHSEKLHDPDHPIGFRRKIKLLKRWFTHHPALVQHRASVQAIATEMLSLSQTRNQFLHSIVDSYDPATQKAVFRAVLAKTDTTYEAQRYEGTLETLLNFAASVRRVHLQFAELIRPDVLAGLRPASKVEKSQRDPA